jgi:hypothetical protein
MALTIIPRRKPTMGQHNLLFVSFNHQKKLIGAACGKNAQASSVTGCSRPRLEVPIFLRPS